MEVKLKVRLNSQNERFGEIFFCEIGQEKIIQNGLDIDYLYLFD